MILNSVFSSRTHRLLAVSLVAVFGLGFSLTAAGQASAQVLALPGAMTGGQPGAAVPGGISGTAPTGLPAALAATTGAKEESEAKPATGMNQGIKMHGHWVIDVKNADGTLAQHHEFENALQFDGQNLLTGLLSGYGVMGGWEIYFTSATGTAATSPCPAGTYAFCAIVQSATAVPGSTACGYYTCVPGLTVTPHFGTGPSVVLAGSITAPAAGSIATVYTGFAGCNNVNGDPNGYPTTIATASPTSCDKATTEALGGTATGTNISPISVAAGQIIQITVTLTFS